MQLGLASALFFLPLLIHGRPLERRGFTNGEFVYVAANYNCDFSAEAGGRPLGIPTASAPEGVLENTGGFGYKSIACPPDYDLAWIPYDWATKDMNGNDFQTLGTTFPQYKKNMLIYVGEVTIQDTGNARTPKSTGYHCYRQPLYDLEHPSELTDTNGGGTPSPEPSTFQWAKRS